MPEDTLFLPCLRGTMGDWAYYVTLMPLSDVAKRVRPAQEIHKSDTLCEMIQRSLTNRKSEIAEYLKRQPQHLFNSIIAGIYEGDPQWYEMELPEHEAHNGAILPESLSTSLGALRLSGSEKIFALDGQHRVAGIKEALSQKGSLKDEQLSVIFVAHNNSTTGLQRSRRLFATLNRYAKPVSKLEIIALDEDDPIAITTRTLLRDHKLLSLDGVIATPKGKNMPNGNKSAFTTAVALYEGLLNYMSISRGFTPKKLKEFIAQRPEDKVLNQIAKEAKELIDLTVSEFSDLEKYSKNIKADIEAASSYRNSSGGHLLFRPVGWLTYTTALGKAASKGTKLKVSISAIAKNVRMEISEYPWEGIIFEKETQRIVASTSKSATSALASLMLLSSELKHVVSDFDKTKAIDHLVNIGQGSRKKVQLKFKDLLND